MSTRSPAVDKLLKKTPDDVVLTFAMRTPMCKAKKGAFKDTSSDILLLKTLSAVRSRLDFDVNEIQDITIGETNRPLAILCTCAK